MAQPLPVIGPADSARSPELRSELAEFRATVRRFVAQEIAPHTEQWERDGIVPLSTWRALGEAGLLCVDAPEAYGGAGADLRFSTLVLEEISRANAGGLVSGVSVHSDIITPYIANHGSEDQKRHWIPKLVRGEVVGAIAMTEPGAGSDLQAMRTTALRDGDCYVINGQKTFITNGQNAGLVVTAAKTDPTQGARGTSLFLVDATLPGYARGRNLDKVGQHMADTSEIFFQDVRVPLGQRLGAEGGGFAILMNELPRERLVLAVSAVAAAEVALEWTRDYVQQRKAFGKPIGSFQNTRFELAELHTETLVGRVFIDWCVDRLAEGRLDPVTAASAKLWTTELQGRVTDRCLQLHGHYGYMTEYPISRAWADARVQRIYGGANEIMKEIISRSLLGRAD